MATRDTPSRQARLVATEGRHHQVDAAAVQGRRGPASPPTRGGDSSEVGSVGRRMLSANVRVRARSGRRARRGDTRTPTGHHIGRDVKKAVDTVPRSRRPGGPRHRRSLCCSPLSETEFGRRPQENAASHRRRRGRRVVRTSEPRPSRWSAPSGLTSLDAQSKPAGDVRLRAVYCSLPGRSGTGVDAARSSRARVVRAPTLVRHRGFARLALAAAYFLAGDASTLSAARDGYVGRGRTDPKGAERRSRARCAAAAAVVSRTLGFRQRPL